MKNKRNAKVGNDIDGEHAPLHGNEVFRRIHNEQN
jgi:hypothetical protein